MGTTLSKLTGPAAVENEANFDNEDLQEVMDNQPAGPSTPQIRRTAVNGRRGRRRRGSDDNADQPINKRVKLGNYTNEGSPILGHSTTSQYIYDTLFVEGTGSDITISALGRQWNLHTLYLKQSGYFNSLLQGDWIDSKTKRLEIIFPDDRVTLESVNISLGSLYTEKSVTSRLSSQNVLPVLATSSFLQLTSLTQTCTNIILRNITWSNVLSYYHASLDYGITEIAASSKRYISNGLLCLEQMIPREQYNNFLAEISPKLMLELIKSPSLVICKDGSEALIYQVLRTWLYQKLNKGRTDAKTANNDIIKQFFVEEKSQRQFLKEYSASGDAHQESNVNTSVLNMDKFQTKPLDSPPKENVSDNSVGSKTPSNIRYENQLEKIFRMSIRLDQVVCDEVDKEAILDDGIIPASWITEAKLRNWDKITSYRAHDTAFFRTGKARAKLRDIHDFFGAPRPGVVDLVNDEPPEDNQGALATYLGNSVDEIILPDLDGPFASYVTQHIPYFFDNAWRLGRKLPDYQQKYTWHWAYFNFGLNLQYSWDIFRGVTVHRVYKFDNNAGVESAQLNLDKACSLPICIRASIYCYDMEGRVLRALSSPVMMLTLRLADPGQQCQTLLSLADENLTAVQGVDTICVQVEILFNGYNDIYKHVRI